MPAPLPILADMIARFVYDPQFYSVHILELINEAKDGLYMKDIISDYAMGLLFLAYQKGIIGYYDIRLFQEPFVRVGKRKGFGISGKVTVRAFRPHCGRPFCDPDGLPMVWHGYIFLGDRGYRMSRADRRTVPRSPYNFDTIQTHPNYQQWLASHLWQGEVPGPGVYQRIAARVRWQDCHEFVNTRPYVPGPVSVPQSLPNYAMSWVTAKWPEEEWPGGGHLARHKAQAQAAAQAQAQAAAQAAAQAQAQAHAQALQERQHEEAALEEILEEAAAMEEIQEEEAALKEFQDDEAALREVQVDDAALQKFLDEKAALQQAQHEALYSHPNDLPDDLPDDLLDDLPDNHPGDLPHDFPGNQLGDQPGDSPENQPGGPALPTNQRRKRANSPKSRRMRRKIRVVHSDNSVEYIWQEYIWNDENSDWAIYDGPGSNASENSNNIAELNTIERQGQQPPRLRRLNDALITRLLTSQRGSRTEKILQASDCIKALTIDNPQLHLEETYKPLGLEVNEATGLLAICSGESTTPILSALSKRSQEIQTFAGRNVSPLEREPIPKPIPQLPNEVSTSEENDSSDIECVDDPAASEVVESEPVEAEQETSKLNQCKCTIPFRDRLIHIYQEHAWRTLSPSIKHDIHNMLSLVLKRLPHPEENGEPGLQQHIALTRKKDALGHYRFARQAVWPEVSLKERLGDEKFSSDILDFLFSPSVIGENWDCQSALKAWAERGSVNIPLFKWWWTFRDATLARIIDEELDMYKHHTRWDLFGNENKGWLVTAYYSIAQQLASQDPVHYAVYTALRPDHCTQLISYPYYAKYSEYDEKAENPISGGFEHIDHNIKKLLREVDGISSQIQGSISLDDEAVDNCTKIVPGFHKTEVLRDWWERVPKEKKKDGPVTRIETPMNWEPAPCQQGDARLTMPQIPHGALPRYPNMKPRRCIFTWLTRINSDQATLASTEAGAGTAQDIALARIACTRPKNHASR
ncbi:hypothetical protein H4I96_12364 [Botrytis cinerea]